LDVTGAARFASGATFTSTTDHVGIARFAAGVTTSALDVTGAARFAGGVASGVTFASTTDHVGIARFAAGISTSGGTFGTPTQLVGTNITGLPVASGISGLCGGIATFLAQSTSANLATAISDETGSGALVFGTSPTLTTPVISTITNSGTITLPTSTSTLATLALSETLSNKTLSGVTLGTPTSGTLTNCTGLPVASGISGLCGGIATFLATPTSANLATALSDKTGTGVNVFATSPTLVTPNIGAATGTSLVLSAGLSANGGTFGTPTQLVGTNITGTAAGFTVGSASLATNSLSLGGTAASGWAQLASPTFTGTVNTSNLIVGGDFTVSGTTTTINSTTLTINDFNIIVGATLSGTGATGAAIATGAGIAVGTGTGISFAYDHNSTSWLSTVDLNVLSGKSYKIGGTTVLNSSALGAGITGSVLTKVGTITLGTWNGTAITDTYLDTISTALKVSNSATTATSANTASAIVARDASGGFTAGTITAALIGNASTATDATNAANIAITSETSDSTCFITFVTDNSSGNRAPKVNSALTYNAASGELSATLIDGGTF
jgi:F0F1-type ATP synthase assembly protein I